jgi:hypothetical protein
MTALTLRNTERPAKPHQGVLIRIDRARVRASDPRNRAGGLKIGRIPLTHHAVWSAKFEK